MITTTADARVRAETDFRNRFNRRTPRTTRANKQRNGTRRPLGKPLRGDASNTRVVRGSRRCRSVGDRLETRTRVHGKPNAHGIRENQLRRTRTTVRLKSRRTYENSLSRRGKTETDKFVSLRDDVTNVIMQNSASHKCRDYRRRGHKQISKRF